MKVKIIQQNKDVLRRISKKMLDFLSSDVIFVHLTFWLSDIARIDHQLLNFTQFDFPLSVKSKHAIPQRLIETVAVEKAYLHRYTNI